MKLDPKIRATPRSVRVAYLLEDGPDAHSWLDAIFADCFGRFGGRQSLIIPVGNSTISKPYQEWLRILDPDVVVALAYENEVLTATLTELLADTKILQRKRMRDEPEKYPRVGITDPGLSALSWLPYLKARSNAFQASPELVLDRYPSWKDDGFITDNFGTLCSSLNPFPIHDQLSMRALVLTPEDAPGNRWDFRQTNIEEISDGYAVIERMAQRDRIMTLAHLSNLHCQPHRTEHSWNQGFCLVIGDSFSDRVSCWNAGLLFDDAYNQSYKTLRVPAAIRGDENRTSKIGHFLRRWNWIGQQNGPANIVVHSSSLTEADVQKFTTQLQAAAMSNTRFNAITSLNDCCPVDVEKIYSAYHIGNPSPGTTETAIYDTTTFVSVSKPIQLSYCAGLHPIFSGGSWLVDLSIDRLNDKGRFDNVRESWRLPIRPQLVRMFHMDSGARILRRGTTSVWADAEKPFIEVKQPDDSVIFHSVICAPPHYLHDDMRADMVKPVVYKYSENSDKGRYLQGILGMFGSLSNVEQVLSKHFWRFQFMDMAAPSQNQHAEVITFLQRRLKAKNGTLLINDDTGWENLAERVIQQSSRLRVPRGKTRYDKLLRAWQEELSMAIKADTHLRNQHDEILLEAPNDLKRALSFLFECGVLYRGHEWSCRHCSHRNWVGIEVLKEIMSCEVCRQEHQLPVDLGLDFRLNEFLATCLREHDTMTVAWALCALRDESRNSFIFAPQTALFRDHPEKPHDKPDHELDIVCIADGKFVIGEAKARVELIA